MTLLGSWGLAEGGGFAPRGTTTIATDAPAVAAGVVAPAFHLSGAFIVGTLVALIFAGGVWFVRRRRSSSAGISRGPVNVDVNVVTDA